jgi:hypothetical protein
MAPKRALYGDFTSAHKNIVDRNTDDNNQSEPIPDFPLPPTPVARRVGVPSSPEDDTSPDRSPTPLLPNAESPLAQRSNDSRFSIKQITRSISRKWKARSSEKTSEDVGETELKDFSKSEVSLAEVSYEGEFPRPLDQSYRPITPKSAVSQEFPATPVSPLNTAAYSGRQRDSEVSAFHPYYPRRQYDSAPLSSMIPSEPANIQGRSINPQVSVSEGDVTSPAYYDDIESLYASSSVYTSDTRPNSPYPSSFAHDNKNHPYARVSGGIDALTNEYKLSIPKHQDSRATSRRVSKSLEQEMFHRSMQHDHKTDTISGFIDHYKRGDSSSSSQPILREQDIDHDEFARSAVFEEEDDYEYPEESAELDFDLPSSSKTTVPSIEGARGTRPKIAYDSRFPPSIPVPSASPFEYDTLFETPTRPNPSDVFSGTSYGDTRQLLQLSQPVVGSFTPAQILETSSSYSQPEGPRTPQRASFPQGPNSPGTPQEALDQADRIFQNEEKKSHKGGIPAIWSRRQSGNLVRLVEKDEEEDRSDWETVHNDNDSPRGGPVPRDNQVPRAKSGRISPGESIANYSSDSDSQGSRDSMGFSGSLKWEDPALKPSSSGYGDQLPGPIGASSPPPLTPWVDAHGLSDKTTLDLLASGPNDDILYQGDTEDKLARFRNVSGEGPFSPPKSTSTTPRTALSRENTFEKFTTIGPRGNLTGTPRGTRMNEVGSSIADNSSPGVLDSSPLPLPYTGKGKGSAMIRPILDPSPSPRISRIPTHILQQSARSSSSSTSKAGAPGFYINPNRRSSVNRVSQRAPEPTLDRSPSQMSLFQKPSLESTSEDTNSRRRSSRVFSQTKLRQMHLAADTQTLSSGTSRGIRTADSERPSTSNTNTPLRPRGSRLSLPVAVGYEGPPRLRCPERAVDPEEDYERRKWTWAIFAVFCTLPPLLILLYYMGDTLIVNLSKGRFSHADRRVRRIALYTGVGLSIGLCFAILIPMIILIARSGGL